MKAHGQLPSRGVVAMASLIVGGERDLHDLRGGVPLLSRPGYRRADAAARSWRFRISERYACYRAADSSCLRSARLSMGAWRHFGCGGWSRFCWVQFFWSDTGMEWYKLIVHDHLTIRTNLFGTTFYSLVGLHASHVMVGLLMLLMVLMFGLTGHLHVEHAERVKVLALYWHFVDAVWVVVFTVVYVVGR